MFRNHRLYRISSAITFTSYVIRVSAYMRLFLLFPTAHQCSAASTSWFSRFSPLGCCAPSTGISPTHACFQRTNTSSVDLALSKSYFCLFSLFLLFWLFSINNRFISELQKVQSQQAAADSDAARDGPAANDKPVVTSQPRPPNKKTD
jgi:hypothetical protein